MLSAALRRICQYSSEDAFANDWHLLHLEGRAVGGAGPGIVESSAVEAAEPIPFRSRIAAFSAPTGRRGAFD
jgi:hypothetical protein